MCVSIVVAHTHALPFSLSSSHTLSRGEICIFCSYDTRSSQSERASHWKEKGMVEERAFFRTITEPATLSLDSIDERDEGDYRCRVDFRKSPTRNTKVRLTVAGEFVIYVFLMLTSAHPTPAAHSRKRESKMQSRPGKTTSAERRSITMGASLDAHTMQVTREMPAVEIRSCRWIFAGLSLSFSLRWDADTISNN
jgi:hypothetical protein